MFQDQSIKDIIVYLFIFGIVLEFIRMLPQAFKALFLKLRRRLKKAKIEELAKELGGPCKSEDECSGKIEQAMAGSLKALAKDIKDAVKEDIQEARREFKSSISRVHTRIDEHLDKRPVA